WDWDRNQWKLQDPHTAKVMLPGGKPPKIGDRMRNPALAATLRKIGREGREAFYAGPVMQDILGRLKELGGLHEEEDFAAQRADWVEPIHAPYRGYEIYECPPNGQGLAALLILRQLEGFALAGDSLSEADRLHLLAEATKNAYRVRDDFIADPSQASVDVAGFLSDDWAKKARRRIRLGRAVMPFGVMGGQYQAVGHAHLVHRVLDRGLDPQQAAEAPRSFAFRGKLRVERGVPEPVVADLARRGHDIDVAKVPLGGCQAI